MEAFAPETVMPCCALLHVGEYPKDENSPRIRGYGAGVSGPEDPFWECINAVDADHSPIRIAWLSVVTRLWHL